MMTQTWRMNPQPPWLSTSTLSRLRLLPRCPVVYGLLTFYCHCLNLSWSAPPSWWTWPVSLCPDYGSACCLGGSASSCSSNKQSYRAALGSPMIRDRNLMKIFPKAREENKKSFNWNFIRLSVEFASYLWFVLEWIFRVNPSLRVIYAPTLSAPHLC